MVKHTQTIRRLNCLSVFDHFVGLALKGLTYDSGLNIDPKTGSRNFVENMIINKNDLKQK